MKIFVLIMNLVFAQIASADILATGFEPGSQQQKKLFTYRENLPANNQSYEVKGTYFGLDGTELVVEQMSVLDGKVATYAIHQRQLKEEGFLEIKDGKLHFSYTANGKTETNTEKAPDNLVVGLSLLSFINAHWEKLMKGETASFRYAVLDRRETVGFKVFKSKEGKQGEISTVTIKMKPTSFVIAALVDPVLMTFNAQDRELLQIVGRALPKKLVKGRWEDQDPEIVFTKEKKS